MTHIRDFMVVVLQYISFSNRRVYIAKHTSVHSNVVTYSNNRCYHYYMHIVLKNNIILFFSNSRITCAKEILTLTFWGLGKMFVKIKFSSMTLCFKPFAYSLKYHFDVLLCKRDVIPLLTHWSYLSFCFKSSIWSYSRNCWSFTNGSGWTLVQVMAWCLTATSLYLNQWRSTFRDATWHPKATMG